MDRHYFIVGEGKFVECSEEEYNRNEQARFFDCDIKVDEDKMSFNAVALGEPINKYHKRAWVVISLIEKFQLWNIPDVRKILSDFTPPPVNPLIRSIFLGYHFQKAQLHPPNTNEHYLESMLLNSILTDFYTYQHFNEMGMEIIYTPMNYFSKRLASLTFSVSQVEAQIRVLIDKQAKLKTNVDCCGCLIL